MYMGVASGCCEQEVGVASEWVECMGVATGCGCKEALLPIPTPLVPVLFFAAASLLFVHKKKVFRSCSSTFL